MMMMMMILKFIKSETNITRNYNCTSPTFLHPEEVNAGIINTRFCLVSLYYVHTLGQLCILTGVFWENLLAGFIYCAAVFLPSSAKRPIIIAQLISRCTVLIHKLQVLQGHLGCVHIWNVFMFNSTNELNNCHKQLTTPYFSGEVSIWYNISIAYIFKFDFISYKIQSKLQSIKCYKERTILVCIYNL